MLMIRFIELKNKYYQEKPQRFTIQYFEGWLEVVNAEKTKYMFTSCEQNAGQNHNMKTANKSMRGKTEIFGYNTK
jgi:hypothetical protein